MNQTRYWSRLRRVRQGAQIAVFAAYLYLVFAALQRRTAFPLADLFFRLDPLTALSASIASRTWIARLSLALLTVVLTVLFGRVWCGWLCPLGTLLQWFRITAARRNVRAIPPHWRTVKNVLLLLIIAMAMFGSLSLLILDPLTLLTRTMTTAVLPALNLAITSVERALYPVAFTRPAINWIEGVLRGPVLPVIQPVFSMSILIALMLAGMIAANALADRFWCRYLCPLGALLGLVSKISLLRPTVKPACRGCKRCVATCPVGAIETDPELRIVPSECIVCLDCLVTCPDRSIAFRQHLRPAPVQEYDPSRRQVLAALLGGAAGVALLRTVPAAKHPDPHLLRPPGAQDEAGFLARCLRCSQCMRVCPTAGLQPVLFEAGAEGMGTPRLVPRLGQCDYGCNACGQVCPSGAIPPLDLVSKRQAVLGSAMVDRNRCLPWAQGIPCIVCEEMCPVPEKAIWLEEVTVTSDGGAEIVIQRPHTHPELCIGCGICENHCPVQAQAAIRVFRV
ncbi:MAG: 4Fe-4S binding protein [Chloroflexi bacterium]|nr:4Fe-4S binding protein [Chloroflexota bacterium]